MAKTKSTMAKAANIRTACKTCKRTGNGGGSNDPDTDESDDNDNLYPLRGGDDGGSGGGTDGNDSNKELLYDYNYMERADMVTLFETLGFSKVAAKQAVRYEQIDNGGTGQTD